MMVVTHRARTDDSDPHPLQGLPTFPLLPDMLRFDTVDSSPQGTGFHGPSQVRPMIPCS
jgi:hypothetical protein